MRLTEISGTGSSGWRCRFREYKSSWDIEYIYKINMGEKKLLNDLWAGMILVGIIYGALTGRMADVTNAALDSSKEAVTLCITMLGVMSFG